MNIVSWLSDLRYNVKWWWQRSTRGYSDNDVWNAGNYIAKYALKLIKAYRDVDGPFGSPIPCEQYTHDDWVATLDEIIWALERFDAFDDPYYDEWGEKSKEEKNNWFDRRSRGLTMFGYYLFDIWD